MNMYERTMMFDKATVLQRLKTNKEAHRAKVEQAWEGYHKQVTEELSKRLDQAKNRQPVDPGFMSRFPVPLDYTREYERVIDRLETSKDSEVELTDDEFNQWMRDEWEWHNRFVANTSAYAG